MRLIVAILLLLVFAGNKTSEELLTIRINFILLQKNDGSGNFNENDSLHLTFINNSVQRLNELYALEHRNIPDSSCLSNHTFADSGIRFRLHKIIPIRNDNLWNNDNDKNWSKCPDRKKWYLVGLQNELDSVLPDQDKGINIYLSVSECHYNENILAFDSCAGNFSEVACSMFPSTDTNAFSVLHYPNVFLKYHFMKDYPSQWAYGTFGRGLAHELGHSLGLTHVKSCNNIMDGAGSVNRKNLSDRQIELARKNIKSSNLKRYLDR